MGILSERDSVSSAVAKLGGKGRTTYCPVCEDSATSKSPSLSVSDGKNGNLLFHCKKSGCSWEKIRPAIEKRHVIWKGSSQSKRTTSIVNNSDGDGPTFHEIYNRARDDDDDDRKGSRTKLALYFDRRGIERVPHEALLLSTSGARKLGLSAFPAVVLPVVNADDEMRAVHLTFLTGDCTANLVGSDKKKKRLQYGDCSGHFIPLIKPKPDRPLIIGEGVESALSASQIAGGLPCISALSSSGMRALEEVPECSEIIIAADNDKAGIDAADALAQRLASRYPGRIIRIATPHLDGKDWNDVLQAGQHLDEERDYILQAPVTKPSGEDEPIDNSAMIDQLAKLDPIAYDQQRDGAAKMLGCRTATLDKTIAKRRKELEDESSVGFLQELEPWGKSVNGEALLDTLVEVLDRHIVLPTDSLVAVALWVLHAHAHAASRHSPVLFISSPTKRCGKTNLLSIVSCLVPKPLSAANITPATVFRAIERWLPTMLIDEADTFVKDDSELRGVLNSGHTKATAYVLRCVGDNMIPAQFSTWCPKAFAGIGRIHPTLEDRSIIIILERKRPEDKVERIPNDHDAYRDLHRKCVRWAKDHLEELRCAKPEPVAELNDRARDNWEPLLAIAEACGGDWPSKARKAAKRLSEVDDDETYSIQLLTDLQWLFERAKNRNLSSKEIVEELRDMEDRPWPEFRNGNPITTRGVAKLLAAFKIKPRQVRIGESRQVQGYMAEQFTKVFSRYVPAHVELEP